MIAMTSTVSTNLLFSHQVMCDAFATPWTVAHQVLLSMEFSRQKYWSRLRFPFPGIFLSQGSKPNHCRWILYYWATGETHLETNIFLLLLFQVDWKIEKLEVSYASSSQTMYENHLENETKSTYFETSPHWAWFSTFKNLQFHKQLLS